MRYLLAIVIATIACLAATADVINVPADHPTIQAAIFAATDGDEIVVAPGTYVETIDLLGKAIVVRSSAGAPATVIDGGGAAPVVLVSSGEGPDTVLEGFTITGAMGTFAGGMHVIGAAPTVADCIFTGNETASTGAGVRSQNGSAPAFLGCLFIGNVTDGVSGGIFSIEGDLTLVECTFVDNRSIAGPGAIFALHGVVTVDRCTFSENVGDIGVGFTTGIGSIATVTDCVFVGNNGGFDGGGLATGTTTLTVANALFAANRSSRGGGAYLGGGGAQVLVNCTFDGNDVGGLMSDGSVAPVVANCIFTGNIPGQILDEPSAPPNPALVTYSDIEGGWSGPGSNNVDVDPEYVGGPTGTWTAPAVFDPATLTTTFTDAGVSYEPNELVGGYLNPIALFPDVLMPITSNDGQTISVLGDFAVWGIPDLIYEVHRFELSPGSPVIDAGDNAAVPAGVTLDLVGAPRFVDDPATPDSGAGAAPIVDLGPYEFQPGVGGVVAGLDIKPGGCPNALNPASKGVLPVALLGDGTFDVSTVDPTTLSLARADGTGGAVQPNDGPPGPHAIIVDVSAPIDGDPCDCETRVPDGIGDLKLKFRTAQLVDALELAGLPRGTTVELVLSGSTTDGTTFTATDCIRIVGRR